MKSGLAAGALSLSIFFLALIIHVNAPTAVQPAAVPQGGAWKAFEWWYAQRAYPNAFIPPKALRKAYDEQRRIQAAKGRDAGISSNTTAWESIGPDNIGGRVLSIAVHPYQTNTVFAGSASGGLWKSVTGGTGVNPWSYVPTGYPALSISAIAIDEMHPDTMYIGTGEISRYVRPLVGTLGARSSYGMGILKSTDGGSSWDTTGLSWSFQNITAVQEIVINPLNPSTVFAATSEGVYRSTDAGESWAVSNTELMAMDLVINPSDTTILISSHGNLNSTANPGLYMTFDGGGSWTKLEGGLPSSNFGRTSLSISPLQSRRGVRRRLQRLELTDHRSLQVHRRGPLLGPEELDQLRRAPRGGTTTWSRSTLPTPPRSTARASTSIKSSNSGTNLPAISSGYVSMSTTTPSRSIPPTRGPSTSGPTAGCTRPRTAEPRSSTSTRDS